MTEVRFARVTDFAALGVRWRDLESRAAGSFFQGWTWTGTLAEERFPDPWLVEATENGRTVALALFNRRRGMLGPAVLYLGETGDPEYDSPWIEQNGVLTEAGREAELTALCLRAVRNHDIVISGLDAGILPVVARSSGLIRTIRDQRAPFADLRGMAGDFLATRSANTRQQVRRSDRYFERNGPIRVNRAASAAEALAAFAAMAVLHQASWTARNRPGCFARPFFRRFHRALIETAESTGEVALLTVSNNENTVGILYNFLHRRRMLAYQSGFGYDPTTNQAKPGLTSHAAAIRWALFQPIDYYDFLAGDGRYKRSLATGTARQFWIEAGPIWSPALLCRIAMAALR